MIETLEQLRAETQTANLDYMVENHYLEIALGRLSLEQWAKVEASKGEQSE